MLRRHVLEENASLVGWSKDSDSASLGRIYMPIQIEVLAAVVVTRAVASWYDHYLVYVLHTVCKTNLPRTPATICGVCGCKKYEPVQALDPTFDFLGGLAVRFGRHRCVFPVDIDHPALCLQVSLEPFCEFSISMAVRKEGRLLSSNKCLVHNLLRLPNFGPSGICAD